METSRAVAWMGLETAGGRNYRVLEWPLQIGTPPHMLSIKDCFNLAVRRSRRVFRRFVGHTFSSAKTTSSEPPYGSCFGNRAGEDTLLLLSSDPHIPERVGLPPSNQRFLAPPLNSASWYAACDNKWQSALF